MWSFVKLGVLLSVTVHSIVAEFRNPYLPVAALFGPKNKFACNAVLLGQGRILTTADCLFLQENKIYSLARPEEFHVALETHSIEQFQNGKAFVKSSKWKYLAKLSPKFGVKYDSKFGNEVFSDKLKSEEKKYLMKALRYEGGSDHMERSHYVPVLNFTIHPEFKGPFSNDLAVLHIPNEYPLDNSSIAKVSNATVESAFNRVVQVHGFGVLSHGANETSRTAYFKMRTVEMYLLPPDRCQQEVGDMFKPDQHMCLKPKSNETLCFGFTGAPIVLDGKLIGIVEFGHVSCSLESPVVGFRLEAFSDFLGLGPSGFLQRIRVAIRNLMNHLRSVRV